MITHITDYRPGTASDYGPRCAFFWFRFVSTSLMLIAIFAVLLAFCGSAGFYGMFAQLFLQIWVLKYCYVLIEHIADGRFEPPVMSTDMLSPFEARPWAQLIIVVGGVTACIALGGTAGAVLATVLVLLLPATIAVLGVGEPFLPGA